MGEGGGIGQQSLFSNLHFNRRSKGLNGLINIFLYFQTLHSEAKDAFAPIPPQMLQFLYVCVQG